MLSKSLREMIKGRWREFRREPSAFFFVILMPVVWMVILGLAFSGKPTQHYTVAVIDQEQRVIKPLQQDPQIKLIEAPTATIQQKFNSGEITLIIQQHAGSLQFVLDPTNPQAITTKMYVENLLQQDAGRQDPLQLQVIEQTTPGSRYIDFLIPGLLAFSLLTTSLFGTGMTIVSNRRENLLKRYWVTPMKSSEYITSHIIGRYLIAAIECGVILAFGYGAFQFSIKGSLIAFLLLTFLGTATFTALGILCAARTKNTSAYNGIINLMILPLMLLGGVWFSKSHFPEWLITIASLLPLTALVDGLRIIALEGGSWMQASKEMLVLLAYLITCSVSALKLFRWY